MNQPNTIIIRLPDEDGSKTFLQIPLQGAIVDYENCSQFQVNDGDDYNLLEFNHIVLAISSDGGDSSIELLRAPITELDGITPAILHSDPVELALLVRDMVTEWNSLPENQLQ